MAFVYFSWQILHICRMQTRLICVPFLAAGVICKCPLSPFTSQFPTKLSLCNLGASNYRMPELTHFCSVIIKTNFIFNLTTVLRISSFVFALFALSYVQWVIYIDAKHKFHFFVYRIVYASGSAGLLTSRFIFHIFKSQQSILFDFKCLRSYTNIDANQIGFDFFARAMYHTIANQLFINNHGIPWKIEFNANLFCKF